MKTSLSALSWLSMLASWLVRAQTNTTKAIYTLNNAWATYYYDVLTDTDGDPCAASQGANWADTSGINAGQPMCDYYMSPTAAPTMKQLGTNRIVGKSFVLCWVCLAEGAAMNRNLLAANMWLCGKKWVHETRDEFARHMLTWRVRVTLPTGDEFKLPEGDLVLWDGCAAAETEPIIDMSGQAFALLSNDNTCSAGASPGINPSPGLMVEILDEYIWQPACDDAWKPNDLSYSNRACLANDGQLQQPSDTQPPAEGSRTSISTESLPTSTSSTFIASSVSAPPALKTCKKKGRSCTCRPRNNSTLVGGGCAFGNWQCNGNTLQLCGATSGFSGECVGA